MGSSTHLFFWVTSMICSSMQTLQLSVPSHLCCLRDLQALCILYQFIFQLAMFYKGEVSAQLIQSYSKQVFQVINPWIFFYLNKQVFITFPIEKNTSSLYINNTLAHDVQISLNRNYRHITCDLQILQHERQNKEIIPNLQTRLNIQMNHSVYRGSKNQIQIPYYPA